MSHTILPVEGTAAEIWKVVFHVSVNLFSGAPLRRGALDGHRDEQDVADPWPSVVAVNFGLMSATGESVLCGMERSQTRARPSQVLTGCRAIPTNPFEVLVHKRGGTRQVEVFVHETGGQTEEKKRK